MCEGKPLTGLAYFKFMARLMYAKLYLTESALPLGWVESQLDKHLHVFCAGHRLSKVWLERGVTGCRQALLLCSIPQKVP